MSLSRTVPEVTAEEHLERFKVIYATYRDYENGISRLKTAIAHLAKANAMDSALAKSALRQNKSVALEEQDVYRQELIARLNEIPKKSSLYASAQYELFMVYYKLRYHKIYPSYQERFQDLHEALFHLSEVIHMQPDIVRESKIAGKLGFSLQPIEAVTAETLIQKTWKNLMYEISGEDLLAEFAATVDRSSYPFRILPAAKIANFFKPAVEDAKSLGSMMQKELVGFVDKNAVCVTLSSVKELPRISPELFHKSNTIIFLDKNTQHELARFEQIEHGLRVVGYEEENINLEFSEQYRQTHYWLINPNGEFYIKHNLKSGSSSTWLIHAKNTRVAGDIHLSDQWNLFVKGKLQFTNDFQAELAETYVQAEQLHLAGHAKAKSLQFNVSSSISQDHKSHWQVTKTCHVTANSLTEIRGELQGDELLFLNVKTNVFLRSAGKLSSTDIVVFAKELMLSSRASIVAAKSLKISQLKKFSINESKKATDDKEIIPALSAEELYIESVKIDNYAHIHGSRLLQIKASECVNHEGGLFETGGICKFSGDSIWNGGKIKAEKILSTLNKLFVHGVANSAELFEKIKQGKYSAEMVANDISITAACYLEFLSYVKTKILVINSLVDCGVGVAQAYTTNKSSVVSLDYGLKIPNLTVYLQKLRTSMQLISEGEYLKSLDCLCDADNMLMFARWVMRTIFPTFGRPIDLIWSMAMLAKRLPSVYEQFSQLYRKNNKIELHEIISAIAAASSLTTQVTSIGVQLQGEYIEIEGLLDLSDPLQGVSVFPVTKSMSSLVLDCVGLFTPMTTSDALIRVEGGITITGTDMRRSLFSSDICLAQVALSLSDQFYASEQHKYVRIANNDSRIGVYSNSDGIDIALQLTSNISEQKIRGHVIAEQVKVDGHSIYSKAKMHGHEVNMTATEKLILAADAKVDADEVKATSAGFLEDKGHLHATEKVTLVGKDVVTDAESQTTGAIVDIAGTHILDQGHISGAHVTEVAEEKLERSATADIQAQHVLLHSNHQLIDGGQIHVTPGAQAAATSDNPEPAVIVEAKSVVTTNVSLIEGDRQSVVITGDSVTESGHIHAKVIVNHAEKDLTITGAAEQTADQIVIKADTAHVDPGFHEQAGQLFMNVNHLTGQTWENILDSIEHHGAMGSSQSVLIDTLDTIRLDHDHDFTTDVALRCSALEFHGTRLHGQQNLSFAIINSDFNLDHQQVTSEKKLIFNCAKGFNNHYGIVQGKEAYICAQGDIINQSGTLQGLSFLQLIAGGSIQNLCTEHDVRARYDTMKSYDVGQILGGSGDGHGGYGLVAYAGKQIINDASQIHSAGSNWIYGVDGVTSNPRSHEYVSYHKVTHHWWGNDSEKTDISTQVQKAYIVSDNGTNTIGSDTGRIYACAADLIAKNGTDIFADQNNVELVGLITETRQYRSNDGLFGLTHSDSEDHQQHAVPTRVISLGNIRIHAKDEAKGDNVYIDTPGEFKVEAINGYFGRPTLDFLHSENYTTLGVQGLSPSQLGFSPLVDDAKQLSDDSSDPTMAIIHSWNTGIDGVNTVGKAMAADRAGHPMAAILSPDTPIISGVYTSGSDRQSWQMPASNSSIHCGTLRMNFVHSLVFNGIPVTVDKNAYINAEDFYQNGVRLRSTHSHDEDRFQLGVGYDGSYSGSWDRQHSSAMADQYSQQQFQVGGALNMNVKRWHLIDATTSAQKLTGHVDGLDIESHAGTTRSSSYGFHAGSQGDFSLQTGKGRSAWISQPSGIETEDSDISIDRARLKGGVFYVNGDDHTTIGTLERSSVNEYSQGHSFGLSGTFQSSDSGAHDSSPFSQTFTPQYGRTDIAGQQSSYYGKGHFGDHAGQQLRHQVEYHAHVKVPIYSAKGADNFNHNLKYEKARFFPAPEPVEMPDKIEVKEKNVHHRYLTHNQHKAAPSSGKWVYYPLDRKESAQSTVGVPTPSDEKEKIGTVRCLWELLHIIKSAHEKPSLSPLLAWHALGDNGALERSSGHFINEIMAGNQDELDADARKSAAIKAGKSLAFHATPSVPGIVVAIIEDVVFDEVVCPAVHDLYRYNQSLRGEEPHDILPQPAMTKEELLQDPSFELTRRARALNKK